MADADKTLKLLIELGVIGRADVEAANGLLAETKSSAEELAKQMGVINVSNEDVAKALGKTGEKSEMTHLSMRRLAHAMGSEIPGGAALMEAAFEASTEPMMGATFLLIAGIEMLKSSLEKINKEKEQATKIADALADADAEHTKVVENEREALEKADVAQAEFLHNYIRNTQNAIDQAEKLAQAMLKTIANGDAGADAGRHEAAGREVENMEQRGVVSHAVALKMKEQLDIAYEQQKLARMIAQDAIEEQMVAKQLQIKQAAAASLAATETSAEARYIAAAQAKAANDTKIEEANKKIETGEQTKKELRDTGVNEVNIEVLKDFVKKYGGNQDASLSEMFHFAAMKNLGVGPGSLEANDIVKMFGSQGDMNLATYEGADIDIRAGKKELEMAKRRALGIDINEGNSKSDLDAARAAMEKNRDQVWELQEQLTTKMATDDISVNGAKANLGMRKAGNALADDQATADRVLGGQAVSNDAAQRLIADASRIAGHRVSLEEAARGIEAGANNIGLFMSQLKILTGVMGQFSPREIEDIRRQIAALQAQMNNSRNRTGG